MSDNYLPPAKESFGSRLLGGIFNALRILIRLLLIVLLVAVFGLLIFGIPYVYYRIVTPIMSKYEHLESAQAEQVTLNQSLLEDLEKLQERASSLEVRLDSNRQQYGELVSMTHTITSTQQAQIDVLSATQIASGVAMKSLVDQLNSLNSKITDLTQTLDQFEGQLNTLEKGSQDLEKRLMSEDAPIAELRKEILILKAMELLTRSRLFITQNNFGLAENDIQNAHDILVDLAVPEGETGIVKDIIDRLEMALDELPDSPVLAAQNLEIAWQLLTNGLSFSSTLNRAPIVSGTLTPGFTSTPTATAEKSPSP